MLDKLVRLLLWRLLWSGTQFLFGIGVGPSGQEESTYSSLAGAGLFGTSQGENDILKSQNFWSSILSGDQSKISQVLGPEESAINKQAQQQKKTTAEFGNRSGGNNAVMQSLDARTTSSINDMVSKLTSSAASNLGSLGTSLFGSGISATTSAFGAADVMHGQTQAQWADIFNSIGTVAGAGAGFAPAGGTLSKILTGIEGVSES